MLSKENRATKRIFRNIMKEGKTFSSRFFLFYYLEDGSPHYAFVAPKNIFKNAVKRNKFRRIGYNTLRTASIKSGSGIFVYKKQSTTVTPIEIRDDILSVINKIF